MNICEMHDIAYESKFCPCCDKDEEIKHLENKIEELQEEIKKMEV